MASEITKTIKEPFIIYLDLEYMIEKIDECKNSPKNWSSTKVSEHIPSGFSISSFRSIENTHEKVWGILKRARNKND